MSAPLDGGTDIAALAGVLAQGNPAPYSGFVRLPGLEVATASPETFLRRRGDRVASRPIKGTGATVADLTDKDRAENVMIVDLVRNDLSRTTVPGTVVVPELCAVEEHPGLVHLVSTVEARLEPGAGWADLLAVTMPPGSVSGAPKSTALEIIARARAGAARPVLRSHRLGRRRPARGRPGRRHPDVLARGRPAALRYGRRHHLALGPAARVGRDRAQGRSGWSGLASVG